MPTIDSEIMHRDESMHKKQQPQNGVAKPEPSPASSMIRVDYQKKSNSSPLETDRSPSSPSSIQEEFYSYLGISSKTNGDSDGDFQPTTTTPTSPLDDFDLSKRRSLRVRVVNKVKQHQAKLLKMAESSATPSSEPEKEAEFVRPDDEQQQNEKKPSLLGRLFPVGEEFVNGISTINEGSSSTILERRCYTHRSPSQSPSTTSNGLQSPSSSSLFLISKLAGSPIPQQSTASSEIFSDFEEEMKKHVGLSERLGNAPTTTTTTSNLNNEETVKAPPPPPTDLQSTTAPPQSTTKERIRRRTITKRIVIRRKEFVRPKPNHIPSKWSIGYKRKMLRLANAGAAVKSKIPPPSTAQPKQLQPEFTIVQKADDVKPYTVLDSDVPLEAQPGPVLGTYYNDADRVLLVVTERRIMFFQHHTNVEMFQKVVQGQSSSDSGTVQRNAWSLIDSTARLRRDEVIDELMFEKRILRRSRGDAKGSHLVYVELRAQRLSNKYNHRAAEMTATYLNIYSLSRPTGDEALSDQVVEARSISLDTIVGTIPDISYTVFPNEMSVAMCWNERQPTRKQIGICKYKLSTDLESLTSVEEFQSIDGELNGLRWGEPKYLIGTGNSQIVIWDHQSGILLTNIHLMDFELGETLYAKVLNVDKQERHLLLVQYWKNYLNVMHVNLLDFAYRVLKSRELTVTREDVHSVVCLDSGNGANVNLALVTGGKCSVGPEILQIFDALTNRLIVMQRSEEEGSRLFLTEKYLIKLRLEPQSISIQSLNEFLLNLI